MNLRPYLQLTKPMIAMVASSSAVTGYWLALGEFKSILLYVLMGTWMTASGACAWNQVQEAGVDALMHRTRGRPIPSGQISRNSAFVFGLFWVVLGVGLLYFLVNRGSACVAMLAVFWYNAIYTPLKKISRFAVIPGALIGALPPWIGWLGGGGDPFSSEILILMLFFFVWQIPHFWLLVLIHGEDIQRSGYPNLLEIWSVRQLSKITFMWMMSLAILALLFPAMQIVSSFVSFALIVICSVGLIFYSFQILNSKISKAYRNAFSAINLFILLFQMTLILDHEIQRLVM